MEVPLHDPRKEAIKERIPLTVGTGLLQQRKEIKNLTGRER